MHDSSSDGVRTILVEREPLNTLDLPAIETLSGLFAAHPPGMALVLSGAGGVFSAGVDSKAFLGYDRATRVALARAITRMTANLLSIPAPVVAAVPRNALHQQAYGIEVETVLRRELFGRGKVRLMHHHTDRAKIA